MTTSLPERCSAMTECNLGHFRFYTWPSQINWHTFINAHIVRVLYAFRTLVILHPYECSCIEFRHRMWMRIPIRRCHNSESVHDNFSTLLNLTSSTSAEHIALMLWIRMKKTNVCVCVREYLCRRVATIFISITNTANCITNTCIVRSFGWLHCSTNVDGMENKKNDQRLVNDWCVRIVEHVRTT